MNTTPQPSPAEIYAPAAAVAATPSPETVRAFLGSGATLEHLLHLLYLLEADGTAEQAMRVAKAYPMLLDELPEEALVERFEVAVAMGKAYIKIGSFESAAPVVEAYVEVASANPDFLEYEFALRKTLYNGFRFIDPEKTIAHAIAARDRALAAGHDVALSHALNNIAIQYYELNRPKEALELYHSSLEMKRRYGDTLGTVKTLENIGHVHLACYSDHEEALRWYLQAYAVAEEHSHFAMQIGTGVHIAQAYHYLGNAEEAFAWAGKTVRLIPREQDRYIDISYLNTACNIAYVLFACRREVEAFDLLFAVLETIDRADSPMPRVRAQAYSLLWQMFRDQGDYKRALDYISRLMEVQSEQRKKQLEEKAAELITRYEVNRYREDVANERRRSQELNELNVEIMRQRSQLEIQASEIINVNETLRKKNNELADLNNQMKELLGIVVHDLRNPLASLSLSLSILKNNSGRLHDDEIKKRIHGGIGAVERMSKILDQLVDSDELSSDLFRIERIRVDVAEVVTCSAEVYRSAAERKDIRLVVHTESALFVIGDKSRLMQVVDNLISNAIKYSPSGSPVEIRAELRDGNVRVSIADSGAGIPQQELPLLFRRFGRLSTRPTAGEESIGLGLSIVKQLTEKMNGAVGVHSEEGSGSTFWIELPAV